VSWLTHTLGLSCVALYLCSEDVRDIAKTTALLHNALDFCTTSIRYEHALSVWVRCGKSFLHARLHGAVLSCGFRLNDRRRAPAALAAAVVASGLIPSLDALGRWVNADSVLRASFPFLMALQPLCVVNNGHGADQPLISRYRLLPVMHLSLLARPPSTTSACTSSSSAAMDVNSDQEGDTFFTFTFDGKSIMLESVMLEDGLHQ
jgi:hypothetical protein